MAKNPANGNFDQGYSGKHGSESADVPPDSMCTNPVARITPAAKALAATKMLPSVRRNFLCFPTSGIAIPQTPATRIDAMATNLSVKAAESSRQDSNSIDWQLALNLKGAREWKRKPVLKPKQTISAP